MLRHKNIDRVCCVILALTLLLSTLFVGAAAKGVIEADTTIGYETRLFDQSRVHTIDIIMNDGEWEAFLDTATQEEYVSCHLVIDGESFKNVAIRGKGNTSLSSVASYGNDRYSFKVEFDHYQSGNTYHGLDKLSLNNLIYDNTYMKDYFAYTLMNQMGVAAPLCSFVQINVNGEPWGLYLAVEGVEDAFLQRNYGKDYGELYKPDSMSFGGGRGNGGDFDMGDFMENFDFSGNFDFSFGDGDGEGTGFTMPDLSNLQFPEGFDPSQMMGSFGGRSTAQSSTATPAPTATATPEPTAAPAASDAASSGASSGDQANASAGMPAMATDGAMPNMGEGMPTGGAMPGMGGDMPNMGEGMPTGGAMPDMSAIPTGSSGASSGENAAVSTDSPAATELPAAPDAGAMPTGGDMPDMSGMPAMPNGGDMPDMGAMELPENFDPSQMMGGSADSGRGFGGFGGGGGGFSMGSEDVKLQYSDDDPSSYSNIFNNAKTDITQADQARLIASLKALNEGDVSVVDTDAVLRYMAVHNFLCNDDSYTGMMVHNYYLYEEEGVLAMIPWDYNLAYGTMTGAGNASSSVNADIDTLVSNGSDSDRPMAGWITASEEYTAQYHAVYQEFMTTMFDSGWFAAEIDRVSAMIAPYVQSDPTAFCTYEEFLAGVDALKSFCLKRAESVTNQLSGDDTPVDASDLDLSVMGSMGNGMGGGMGGWGGDDADRTAGRGKNRSENPASATVPAQPEATAEAPDPGASPTPEGDAATQPGNSDFSSFAGSSGDTSSFGGQSGSTSAEASPTANVPAESPSDAPAQASPDASPPSVPAETMNRGDRSDFGASFMPSGTAPGTSSSAGWAWLAVCAVLLAAALIFAACYKNNR